MKKRRQIRRYTVLGLFLVGGLIGLTVLTFRLTNLSLEARDRWTVHFGQNSLVKEGYEVWTAGTKCGIVEEVTLVPDEELAPGRHVRVVLAIKTSVTLWEGAEIVVASQGLLGRPVIHLRRGTPRGKLLDADQPLRGRIDAGLFATLGQVVSDNRTNLGEFTKNMAEISRAIKEGRGTLGRLTAEDGIYQRAERILAALERFATALNNENGTLGRLLNDPALYNDVAQGARALREVAENLRAGRGTMGRLLSDESLAKDIQQTAASIRRIAGRLERSDSTLGRLLNDDQLYRDFASSVQSLRRFAERVEKGDGTFSKLLTNDDIYQDLRVVSSNLKRISEDLEAGKGSLGMLLKDETLFKELVKAVQGLREGAEVALENAPISSMTSFVSLFFNVLN